MVSGNLFKGALLMCSANVAYCIMACMVKCVAYLNCYTTTLFRFLIGLGIMGLLAMSGRINLSFVNKKGLFVRGIMGGAAIAISFLSITKLGLLKAGIIIQLYPVFATIFGWIMLKERLSIVPAISILCSFLGVCLLLADHPDSHQHVLSLGIYDAIAVIGALLGGLTVILVKKLQATDSTPSIFFAQCLGGFWIVLIPASVDMGSISLCASFLLVAIGILATVGQLLSTDSYRYLPVATASALVMMLPLFTSIAGIILFHERLGVPGYIGAGIVLVSTVGMLGKNPIYERKGV